MVSVHDRYRGQMSEASIVRLVEQYVARAAIGSRAAGCPEELYQRIEDGPKLTIHRWVAMELCGRIAGIDRDWLCGRFNLKRRGLRVAHERLNGQLKRDETRATIVRIFHGAGFQVPGSMEEREATILQAQAIWEDVATGIGLQSRGELLAHRREPPEQLRRWRALAADISCRLPAADLATVARALDRSRATVTRYLDSANELPDLLRRDLRLRTADMVISREFGVPWRRESDGAVV